MKVKIILHEVINYINNAVQSVKPAAVIFVSIVNYILFPDRSYIPAAVALGGAMLLDIITKYYALSINNQGLKNAIKQRIISSETLWMGTKRKLISYFIIMILCGLSARVSPLTFVADFMSTVAYSILFLKESQSVIENLIDAGHTDLEWFLFWLKKKQNDVLESNEAPKQTEETFREEDYSKRV